MDELLRTPIFNHMMSRNRFEDLLLGLHFVDNLDQKISRASRFWKLGKIWNAIMQKFKHLVTPGEFLSIDESLLKFKGKLSFRQYMPFKRARFGVKFFGICDNATKILLNYVPYQGKHSFIGSNEDKKELGVGGAVVMHLSQDYTHCFRKICMDNWFSSPLLAEKLLKCNTFCLSTAKKGRKYMPSMKTKLASGQVETFSANNILVQRWKDKRDVVMLNTFLSHEMIPVTTANPACNRDKPSTVLCYNKNMGGIDQVDRKVKTYESQRKSTKWYKKVFFHLVDLCVYNSYMVWKILHPGSVLTYKQYILAIIKKIFQEFPPDATTKGKPPTNPQLRKIGNHFPNPNIKNGKSGYSNCHLCKLESKRVQTKFKCTVCNVFLCINTNPSCFQRYHTISTLPKPKPLRPVNQSSEPLSLSLLP